MATIAHAEAATFRTVTAIKHIVAVTSRTRHFKHVVTEHEKHETFCLLEYFYQLSLEVAKQGTKKQLNI